MGSQMQSWKTHVLSSGISTINYLHALVFMITSKIWFCYMLFILSAVFLRKCVHRMRLDAQGNLSWMGNLCSCEYALSQQTSNRMDFHNICNIIRIVSVFSTCWFSNQTIFCSTSSSGIAKGYTSGQVHSFVVVACFCVFLKY